MTSLTVDKKFKSDEVFNAINKHFITLKDEDMYQYNVHLSTVLNKFIERMKEKDVFFNACYQRLAYVGSYYEGLKVGKPDEFDLNVIINLPFDYNNLTTEIDCQRPGYIRLQANSDVLPNLKKHPKWSEYKVMKNWFDGKDYLDQNEFRSWFESVVIKALFSFEYVNGKYILEAKGKKYLLSHKKSGPAWTMKIDVPQGHTVDVDLVPVLNFPTPPPEPFKNHKTTRQNWFAVPKRLEGGNNNILWRPSFYEREQEKLRGIKGIKEVIRQMKKLRDTCGFHSIASYYIKTLFLWELEENYSGFQTMPTTFVFVHMLKKLRDACTAGEIYDFWNPKNNLLSKIGRVTLDNMRNRLNFIIGDIDDRIVDDPYVIAKYVLTPDEFDTLKQPMQNAVRTNDRVQQDVQSNGYLSAIWNWLWENIIESNGYFSSIWNWLWGLEAIPATQ